MNVNNNNLNAQNVSLFFPIKSFYEYVNGGEQSGSLSVVKKVLNLALPIIALVNLLMLPFIAAYNCFFSSNIQVNPENESAKISSNLNVDWTDFDNLPAGEGDFSKDALVISGQGRDTTILQDGVVEKGVVEIAIILPGDPTDRPDIDEEVSEESQLLTRLPPPPPVRSNLPGKV